MQSQNSSEFVRLERCYQNTVSAISDSSFFASLISYVDVLENSVQAQEVVKLKLEPEANLDLAKLKELSEIILRDGLLTSTKLLENKLVASTVSKDIIYHKNNLINFIKSEYKNKVDEFVETLNRFLIAMDGSDDKSLVKISRDYATLDEDGRRVITWSWSEKQNEYEIEKNKLDRIKDIRVWFQYNELVSMYEIYMNHESQQKMFLDQGQLLKAWNYSGAFKELRDIISGTHKGRPYFYVREVFERYLRNVNTYFLYQLSETKSNFSGLQPDVTQAIKWPEKASMVDGVLSNGTGEVRKFNKGYCRKITERLFSAKGRALSLEEINTPYITAKNSIRDSINVMNRGFKNVNGGWLMIAGTKDKGQKKYYLVVK